jgi:hypothetical protein
MPGVGQDPQRVAFSHLDRTRRPDSRCSAGRSGKSGGHRERVLGHLPWVENRVSETRIDVGPQRRYERAVGTGHFEADHGYQMMMAERLGLETRKSSS